jgi:hypothetical protein
MLNKELLNYNNKLYWIYRRIKESNVVPTRVNDVKEFWGCDIVLKQNVGEDNILIFLREIPEVEVLQ